jgi:hypothetical protein
MIVPVGAGAAAGAHVQQHLQPRRHRQVKNGHKKQGVYRGAAPSRSRKLQERASVEHKPHGVKVCLHVQQNMPCFDPLPALA